MEIRCWGNLASWIAGSEVGLMNWWTDVGSSFPMIFSESFPDAWRVQNAFFCPNGPRCQHKLKVADGWLRGLPTWTGQGCILFSFKLQPPHRLIMDRMIQWSETSKNSAAFLRGYIFHAIVESINSNLKQIQVRVHQRKYTLPNSLVIQNFQNLKK